MNSHGQPSNAARGFQGISAYASVGYASARPLSYSFVVVVLQVVIILLAQSG